ncbi:pectinesterase family protein [Limosilactobacillus mucosae]|uniref:KxYKxGKxW signal peptide domain-containing protein n=2 Tax=Limosilactobacillus mucosae TaxID=97478 RepID=A0A7L9VUE6_LIMMU|nr:pectinesterase family protein [Limosilactobacillus mucosae]QOL70560.1 KxYKxGKxW signal peptide domain-containing protein [Limosilactobacillus mucosae]
MSDYKMHFKMYKSGKLWIVAGIAAISLLIGGANAYADTGNSMQSTAPNVIATPVSSVENQTNESSKVDSISGSVNNEGAPTKNESAAAVASDNQSSVSRQATTDDQNNNVQNTTVAKDTQSATTSASDSNTVVRGQTGTLPVNQVSGTTEVHQDGHWYLKDFQGNYLNGWQKLTDNRIVYYDPQNNQMQYGEHQINNQWYYFDTNCGAVVQGWYVLADGRKVYYDVANDGTGRGMLHGVQTIDGQTYDFNIYTGAQTSGWKMIDGQKYYFAPAMVHGMEKQIDGHWYCFDDMGKMRTGFVRLNDGREVYYNADGQMQYGEQKINDKWYHFQTDNGNMARGWYTLEDGRRVYYDVDADGNGTGMLYGLNQINNQSYYFDASDGDEKIGLQVVDNQTYYFNSIMVKNGEAKIGNHWYYFNAVGQMQTGFVTLKDGRLVYYNADGQMQYGEQKINGKWYHFQTDNGNTARGWYTLEDGRRVYYDVDGTGNGQGMLHGLGKVGNDYYYFNDATGAKETGLKTLNGQTYNFVGNNGQALLSQFWINDNQTYYFDQQGQMVKNQQLTIAGEQWQFDANGVGTKVAVTIADNWNFDKKNSSELNNLGNIEGTTGEYNGLLIDASKPGAKFSPRDVGDTQVNANTVIGVPVKANQYGAKITIELSGGTVDLTTSQGSQTGLKGTFTLTVPAMATDGTFSVTFNSSTYLKNLKVDYLTQAPEEYPGTPSNVKAEDTDWNLAAGSKQITAAQNSRAEYLGLKIDASTAGAKFAPRDNNDGTGLDTQINSGTIIYIPIAANQNGVTLKLTGQKSAGLTIMLNNQAVTLGNEIKIDATSTPTYLKIQFAGTGSAYLTDIAVHYNVAYPGTPTVSAKDADWNLSNDNSRPTVQNNQGEYNGLKIDGTNGKFAPRATDTQVNNGTIIYIPIAADAKGAKVTISGTANGQTLTLDGQTIALGQAISVDSTSAHYLKLLVSGTGSAYLTAIAVDYGSDTTNDFPGALPTGKSEDISWDLAQAGNRPSAEKSTTSYNGLQIDARNGKFSPRATGDTQINGGTAIYIPLYQDAKGATLKVSGTANGQTLTLDGQSITLGTPVMLDATTARYLKLTVTGTGSAYLTGIDLDYLSDDSYQTHVVKVGANEQYKTIQSALDANQSSLKDRLVLAIDPGTYTEAVQVNKPGVVFKNADSTGQKAVVITYNNYSSNTFDANGNFVPQDSHDLGTSKCGTVIVTAAATGFSAENITFENSYNVTDHTKEGEQTPAVAFDSLADQVYLKNCSLIGRQDTVYLQGKGNRVYINGGKIEGTVDFVFGDANALIENAAINMAYYPGRKTGYFAAPNTAKGQTGLVFNNCQLTVDNQYGSNAVIYLARPWQTTVQTTSKVVNGKTILTAYDPNTKDSRYTNTSSAVTFINCQLPSDLAQNVFGGWTGKYEDASGKQSTVDITYHPDVRFIEFNNNTTADKKSLTDEKGNVLGTIQTGDASAYLKQVMSEMKIGTTADAWQPVDKI